MRSARAERQRAREELRKSRRDVVFAAGFGVLALAAIGADNWADNQKLSSTTSTWLKYGLAAAVVVFGFLATRRTASALGHLAAARAASKVAAPLRLITSATGYVIVLFAALGVLKVPISHLLVGAGLAGVVLGIAGQQSLGNLFAGMVLIAARPFTVGDNVRVRSGALGGVFEGVVIGMSLTYVTLNVDGISLKVPNSGMLAAAVGRLPRRSGTTGPVPVVNGGTLAVPPAPPPASPGAEGVPAPNPAAQPPAVVTTAAAEPVMEPSLAAAGPSRRRAPRRRRSDDPGAPEGGDVAPEGS